MQPVSKPYLILASQSPRRKMLLDREGYSFEVIPSLVDEIDARHDNVVQVVQENARIKGRDVVSRLTKKPSDYPSPTILLASDTLVAMGARVFPKPKDLDQAHEFLSALGGKTHQVHTGVFLYHLQSRREMTFCDTTYVQLAALSYQAREDVFSKVNPLDKAGAYGAQGSSEMIQSMEGHLSTVIGLPVEELPSHIDVLLNA